MRIKGDGRIPGTVEDWEGIVGEDVGYWRDGDCEKN